MENTIAIPVKVPIGVRVIALLNYTGAIGGVLWLIFMFLIIGGPMIIVASIVAVPIIIFSILGFCIGRGLYRGKNWARVMQIVFGVLGLLYSVVSLAKGMNTGILIGILVNILITGYLLFNKNVKAAFTKKEVSNSSSVPTI